MREFSWFRVATVATIGSSLALFVVVLLAIVLSQDSELGDEGPPSWFVTNQTHSPILFVIDGIIVVVVPPSETADFGAIGRERDENTFKAYEFQMSGGDTRAVAAGGEIVYGSIGDLVFCAVRSRSEMDESELLVVVERVFPPGVLNELSSPCPGT